MINRFLIILSLAVVTHVPAEDITAINKQTDGYRGAWYFNQRIGGEYIYKYSGGLGTYCAKHKPFAVHCPEVQKTFFCYGGVNTNYIETFRKELSSGNLDSGKPEGAICHLVAYFDHKTGMVPKPTVLLDKRTFDAHDNPVITVDDAGYIWILSTAHGNLRPAFVHKSRKPYDISEFERISPFRMINQKKEPITNFSYMQVWHVPKQGFVYFFTKYDGWRRETCFATSTDGIEWSWSQLADIEEGHYQISAASVDKAATAFNYHPRAFRGNVKQKGLNWRTNLYYMETPDRGKTWRAADGTALNLPLTEPLNAALVHNYESEGLLLYLKDIGLDREGRPVILFITAQGFHSGPGDGPRTWRVAQWSGSEWTINDITTSDSNYDMGSLYIEEDGLLRVIAPTEKGPQPYNPGGEVAMWTSEDSGKTWKKVRQMTVDSQYNHSYVRRPVNANPDFYGFWTDGHGREPSPSRLYFCNRSGDVFRLPQLMSNNMQAPERITFGNKAE